MKRFKSLFRSKKKKSRGRGCEDFHAEVLSTEVIEERRQENLRILQKEFEQLECQLTDERATLTSRSSDSDLEHLYDAPMLKRNSISLQDIPQSVINIRREKQLRQMKEEIEHLKSLSQNEGLDKEPLSAKSPFLEDIQINFPQRKVTPPTSPEVEVSDEPLSKRVSYLKANRKLQEIRSEMEGLAFNLIHAEEIRAKTTSLEDLPRTALGIRQGEQLLSIAAEIEHVKNYKLKQKTVLSTVFPESESMKEKAKKLEKLNRDASFSKSNPSLKSILKKEEHKASTESMPSSSLVPTPSIKRFREQELNRVRVELRELSCKLSLHSLNMEDTDDRREKKYPSDWPRYAFSRENSFGK